MGNLRRVIQIGLLIILIVAFILIVVSVTKLINKGPISQTEEISEETSEKMSEEVSTEPSTSIEYEYNEPLRFDEKEDPEGWGFYGVDKLFNYENREERVKSFLGENYDEYKDVLSYIENNKDIFKRIPTGGYFDIDSEHTLGILNRLSLGLGDDFEIYHYIFIENSLSIIDFFDNDIAVTAYNYPENPSKELVVIDYSDVKVNPDTKKDVFKLGDIVSIKVIKGEYLEDTYEDFKILYIKG